jgi:hypothetical protein
MVPIFTWPQFIQFAMKIDSVCNLLQIIVNACQNCSNLLKLYQLSVSKLQVKYSKNVKKRKYSFFELLFSNWFLTFLSCWGCQLKAKIKCFKSLPRILVYMVQGWRTKGLKIGFCCCCYNSLQSSVWQEKRYSRFSRFSCLEWFRPARSLCSNPVNNNFTW